MKWGWHIGTYLLHLCLATISHSPISDCSPKNLLVDASALYPSGYHPCKLEFTPDCRKVVRPLLRSKHAVRYYYDDFGISSHITPGSSKLVTGRFGRNRRVPELSKTVPYDPFKVDIFSMGQVFEEFFTEVCFSAIRTAHALTSAR